jgi:dienelactone hydrolase
MTAEPIEIPMPDNTILRGVRWPGGDDAVVLVHDAGQDLDAWRPLTDALAASGFSAIAIDLRGHGASDGEWTAQSGHADLQAILAGTHPAAGGRLILVGAGTTGTAALAPSFHPRPDAVILFSPTPLPDADTQALRGEAISKLFVVGSQDPAANKAAVELRNRSIGMASLVSVPTDAHGTALLDPPWRQQLVEKVLAFLSEIRSVSQEVGA